MDFDINVLAEIGRRDVSRRAQQLMLSQRKTALLKLLETSSPNTTIREINERLDAVSVSQSRELAEQEVYRKLQSAIYSLGEVDI